MINSVLNSVKPPKNRKQNLTEFIYRFHNNIFIFIFIRRSDILSLIHIFPLYYTLFYLCPFI